ncbi:MAG: recombinase family protein [Pseudomonadota bacterium]
MGESEELQSDTCLKVAQYVRMSTEHQRYSIDNQEAVIASYAEANGMEIVRTYSDSGKSGLSVEGRSGLKRLIVDVDLADTDFEAILVYDVSRWGRFQDADESAYYEYICKQAGIAVHYCAEQFDNDGSPVSTIVKGVKRAMAGEYSRELSAKVFAGQCRLIEKGFRQGGPAGYGLRRMLVDEAGRTKTILQRGEHKSLQTDRVILVPGPDSEVGVVNRIYRAFTNEGVDEATIAKRLNSDGIKTDFGNPWTRGTVHQVLTNEKYVGNNVFNRTSTKLKQPRRANAPEDWVRSEGAFEAIVPVDLFHMAQGIIRERARRFSDEEMLDRLKRLYEKRGVLSGIIIDEYEDTPSSSAYAHRFGSLLRAYSLVGFEPLRDYRFIAINRRLRVYHQDVVRSVVSQIEALGGHVEVDSDTDLLIINREFTASVSIARFTETGAGLARWNIRFDSGLKPNLTIGVRMDSENAKALDYYLLPAIDFRGPAIRLALRNAFSLDTYRFDTLAPFFEMARRVQLLEAA